MSGRKGMTWAAPHNDLEKIIQDKIVRLYRMVGCRVWNLSQARASRQTPGLPDLIVKHPVLGKAWTHEVKGPKGKLRKGQEEWAEVAAACGETHLVGGITVAESHLLSLGLVAYQNGQMILTPKRAA